MTSITFRYIAAILLLISTSAVVNALQYTAKHDDETGFAILRQIPSQIGEWQGRDYPLEEKVYDILETRSIIHRSFNSDSGQNAFLSIVHYHDTKVDFHRPESCLGGRGVELEKTTKAVTLQSNSEPITFDIARIISTSSNGKTLVYYFFKANRFIGSSYLMMRLNIAANKMTGNDTRGSLIRISTNYTPGRETEAETVLLGFLQDLFPHIENLL
ncbi:exosortase C-terminal domain/associated protein EpsI [Desulfosediminicola ganghwensis]|uniref:exosortase C-terminal domain/associated protein EpsI n=1 Tax=Desulfosediminicola ganghwensis TaxID=2569540 RepID=UPI0010AC3A85|nr:exosortase C-terminal domain/associated protein EpsI [Desulfosediminicola ganghwensis]